MRRPAHRESMQTQPPVLPNRRRSCEPSLQSTNLRSIGALMTCLSQLPEFSFLFLAMRSGVGLTFLVSLYHRLKLCEKCAAEGTRSIDATSCFCTLRIRTRTTATDEQQYGERRHRKW